MKISAQDEYGLRVLIQIARADAQEGMSLPQLCEAEGLSSAYMAKITRALRLGGYIQSTRGHKGGYVLNKKPSEIIRGEVLRSLGGALFDDDFCGQHSGEIRFCTNSVDCSVRSLWRIIQLNIDSLLEKITLEDLIGDESTTENQLQQKIDLLPTV